MRALEYDATYSMDYYMRIGELGFDVEGETKYWIFLFSSLLHSMHWLPWMIVKLKFYV